MNAKKEQVQSMFDAIAHRYDLLNRVLSGGTDVYWRRKALKLTRIQPGAILLDIACGTGDVSIEARKMGVTSIFGADVSYNMLTLFQKKSDWITGKSVQMVAEHIPLKGASVTNITVAFGVRNFYDLPLAFASFHRILKPGGKATILEFRMPSNPLVKAGYRFYFKRILPFLGKFVSKHPDAYQYLPDSVEEFDRKVNLPQLLQEAGFKHVEAHPLTFGIAQVVIATK